MTKCIYCDGRGIQWNRDNPGKPPKTVLLIEFVGDELGKDKLQAHEAIFPNSSHAHYDPEDPKDGGRITVWQEVEGPIEIMVDGRWETIP